MIICEECIQDPIPHCHVCEELLWLHEFRLNSRAVNIATNTAGEEE